MKPASLMILAFSGNHLYLRTSKNKTELNLKQNLYAAARSTVLQFA